MTTPIALAGRVVVITGASAGIGKALALEVSRRNAKVVLAARREPALAAVAAACREAGAAGAVTVRCDVTVRADVERLAGAGEEAGGAGVWVNNAGLGITRMPSQISDEDFDEMMLVNVKSALWGMQAVLPHMKRRKRGQVMNVSSMLGRVPFALPRAMYSAAKHALNALSTSMRMEIRAELPDVWITTVYPGVVATDFGLNARHGGVDNRALPNAQDVDEVAKVIADAMVTPRAEVFTRPEYRQMVAGYYAAEDLTDVESKPPFRRP